MMYGLLAGGNIGLIYNELRYKDDKANENKEEKQAIYSTQNSELSRISASEIFAIATAEAILDFHKGKTSNLTLSVYAEKYKKYFEKYKNELIHDEQFFKSGFKNVYDWINGKNGVSNNAIAVSRSAPIGMYFSKNEIEKQTRLSCLAGFNNGNCVIWSNAFCLAILYSKKEGNNLLKAIGDEIDFKPISINQIKKENRYNITAEKVVPVSISIFLESNSFEDAMQKGIEAGGNSTEILSMVGALAESKFGIPQKIIDTVKKHLNAELIEVVESFNKIAVR